MLLDSLDVLLGDRNVLFAHGNVRLGNQNVLLDTRGVQLGNHRCAVGQPRVGPQQCAVGQPHVQLQLDNHNVLLGGR